MGDMGRPLFVALPGFEPLAAAMPGIEAIRPAVAHFANGELGIELDAPVAERDCVVLGTTAPPADHLAELLLAADTLDRHGARSVRALVPYLAYARQDRLEPGHSLAAAWLGRVLEASGVRGLITVDVHSDDAVQLLGLPVTSLSAAPLFAGVLSGMVSADAVAVAPDAGARPRTRALAEALGLDRPIAWLQKQRRQDGVTHGDLVGELAADAIVVDDILDTGGTLLSCCRELRARGVEEITVVVTHGLFTGSRWRELSELGVTTIHTTDSVAGARLEASPLVRVHTIAPLLVDAISLDASQPAPSSPEMATSRPDHPPRAGARAWPRRIPRRLRRRHRT
jgi:ribose-phosphate pyrophosphokinase